MFAGPPAGLREGRVRVWPRLGPDVHARDDPRTSDKGASLSVYQWIGSNNADLGNGGNWVDTSEPGMGQPPGTNDIAIIQVGEGLYGTLNVAALDLVQASGAPPLSITGSSTQVTAASVGIGLGFTLDTGAFLQAGTLGIDGDGTDVTVQNNAILYDSAGENDVFDLGASTGNATLLVTRGGTVAYNSLAASGTLNLGGVSGSVATMTVSAGGYFESTLSSVNIGAASGATGVLNVTGAGSQFIYDNYGYTTIGDYGELNGSAQGTVSVTAGGYASLSSDGEVDVGTSAGMAKIVVSGANSAVQAGPFTEIGIYGTNVAGEILVQAGGEFDNATDALLNNGTIAVAGAGSLFTARFLVADGGTTVQVSSGGSIHVADVELGGIVKLAGGGVNARADFITYGGSEVVGNGTVSAAAIANAGLLVANGGTLLAGGSITGTGGMRIMSGATLQLSGPVAASQTIQFESGANRLALGDAGAVAAHITDFATGDAIDLLGDAATKLAYAGGALSVSNGSTLVAKLEIKGSYTTANFRLASDGHGGSVISYAGTDVRGGPGPIGDMFRVESPFMHRV